MSHPEDISTPGDHLLSLDHDGRARRYIVHVPTSYDPWHPWPLVLSFHGSNSNGQIQLEFTAMNETADREGFLIAYPFGTGERERLLFWNAGNCCGYAFHEQVDDVGFVAALLDQLRADYAVDDRRVYATGMSNGGMMAYRLANEMAETFAAIAAVAGTMGFERATPSRPISILHIHSTDDAFVPFEGGVGPKSPTGTHHYSVEETIQEWARANGCPPTPHTMSLPNREDDGTSTVRYVYGPGRDNTEVVLYLIHGAGHIWPGRPPRPYYLGKTTYNWSANGVIWEFFQRHSR